MLDSPDGVGFFKDIGMAEKFPNEYYIYFAVVSLFICALHFFYFLKDLILKNKKWVYQVLRQLKFSGEEYTKFNYIFIRMEDQWLQTS